MSTPNKTPSAFKWTEDITRKFIQLRIARHDKFTGKKNSAATEWDNILHILAIDEYVTPDQAKKKWANLVQKYKEVKKPKLTDDSEIDVTWPFVEDMEEALANKGNSQSMILNSLVMENGEVALVDLSEVAEQHASGQYQLVNVTHGLHNDSSTTQRNVPFKKRKRKAPPRPDDHAFMESVHSALTRIEDKIDQQSAVLNSTMNQLVCCLTTLVNNRTRHDLSGDPKNTFDVS